MGKLEPRVKWSFVPSTKIAITKQKIDFWPQISKFWGQKSTFSPLAANWSLNDQCFQHKKGVSLQSRYEGTKIFTPCPKKLDFGPKNGQIWPKTGILGQISAFLPHLIQGLTKNYMNKVPRWVFRYVGNKTFDFSSKKKDFLPKNDQVWPKTGIFGQFGPGHAGLFSALLVGRLVVVARGLYLARHLTTIYT